MSIIEIPYNIYRLSFNYGQVLVVVMGERSELSYSVYISMSYKILVVTCISSYDMLFTLYISYQYLPYPYVPYPSLSFTTLCILSSLSSIVPICSAYYIPYRFSMCDCFVNVLLCVDYMKITVFIACMFVPCGIIPMSNVI